MVAKGAQWATLSIARSTFTFYTHHPVFIYCQFLLYFFFLQKYYRYLSLSLSFSVYKIQFNCLDCLFPSSYSFFVYLSQSPKATKTRTTKKRTQKTCLPQKRRRPHWGPDKLAHHVKFLELGTRFHHKVS